MVCRRFPTCISGDLPFYAEIQEAGPAASDAVGDHAIGIRCCTPAYATSPSDAAADAAVSTPYARRGRLTVERRGTEANAEAAASMSALRNSSAV